MRGQPDNNAGGAEGTIPYIYIYIYIYMDFCRFLFCFESSSRGGGSGVYSFEQCIVFVQFSVEG